MHESTDDSKLEAWLRKRNMTTNRLVELVGCSRPVIWKAKRGIAICPFYARRIFAITNGEILPVMERVGAKR